MAESEREDQPSIAARSDKFRRPARRKPSTKGVAGFQYVPRREKPCHEQPINAVLRRELDLAWFRSRRQKYARSAYKAKDRDAKIRAPGRLPHPLAASPGAGRKGATTGTSQPSGTMSCASAFVASGTRNRDQSLDSSEEASSRYRLPRFIEAFYGCHAGRPDHRVPRWRTSHG